MIHRVITPGGVRGSQELQGPSLAAEPRAETPTSTALGWRSGERGHQLGPSPCHGVRRGDGGSGAS